jgi:hypothetical protein
VDFVPAIFISVTLICEELGSLSPWLRPSELWIPTFTLTRQAEAGMV